MSNMMMMGAGGSASAAYVQYWVDNNNSAYASFGGAANTKKFTFSLWLEPQEVSGIDYLVYTPRWDITRYGSQIGINLKDNTNTLMYAGQTTSNVLSTSTRAHVYVSVDLTSTNDVQVKINGGSAEAMSASTDTWSGNNVETNLTTYLLHNGAGGALPDIHLADWFIDYTQVITVGTLYNGGTPPSLTSIGSPALLLGNGMKADERAGNTAQGWNDGYNLGSGGTVTVTNTFLDV